MDRGGLPQTAIIPTKVSKGRKTTKNLQRHAKSMRFGITKATIPFREIFIQSADMPGGDIEEWQVPPSLVWNLGRNQKVREAALEMGAVFQEIFAGACQEELRHKREMAGHPVRTIKQFIEEAVTLWLTTAGSSSEVGYGKQWMETSGELDPLEPFNNQMRADLKKELKKLAAEERWQDIQQRQLSQSLMKR